MNSEDLSKMLEMRKNGKSYREIGDLFGVSRQYIHQVLSSENVKEDIYSSRLCIYKGLSEFMKEKNVTIKQLACVVGARQATMSKCLTGEAGMKIEKIKEILVFTGLDFDKCFELKNDFLTAGTVKKSNK